METKSAASSCGKLKGMFVMSCNRPGWIVVLAVIFIFLLGHPPRGANTAQVQGRIRYSRSRTLKCTIPRAIKLSRSKLLSICGGAVSDHHFLPRRIGIEGCLLRPGRILGQLRLCKGLQTAACNGEGSLSGCWNEATGLSPHRATINRRQVFLKTGRIMTRTQANPGVLI